MSRTFRLISISGDGINHNGKYRGNTPIQAAEKAFSMHCRVNSSGACNKRFKIQEITRGSNGKVFAYVGSRELFSCPKQIIHDGVSVVNKYDINVRRAA